LLYSTKMVSRMKLWFKKTSIYFYIVIEALILILILIVIDIVSISIINFIGMPDTTVHQIERVTQTAIILKLNNYLLFQ